MNYYKMAQFQIPEAVLGSYKRFTLLEQSEDLKLAWPLGCEPRLLFHKQPGCEDPFFHKQPTPVGNILVR